ncbi:MAG: hypothetical protein LQ352_006495 [Teloschistes flavicans]|nr:MAG: hypothetical protein LQ352_006495 [Teloschistes flavicans]
MPEKVHHQFQNDAEDKTLNSSAGSSPNRLKRKRNDENYSNGKAKLPAKEHRSALTSASRTLLDQQQRRNDGETARQQRPGKLKERARALWAQRQKLPIWAQADTIRQSLRGNDRNVLLLVGETGSGKSTQVPQILAQEPWCTCQSVLVTTDGGSGAQESVKIGGCIAITEPRRVAAVSLARRVAEEVGTPLGSSSPASTVGYNVRFDNSTGPCTKIKFLTEGMLLQEMLRDPWLRKYSAVIVDEVHERGVNVDLVLGFLRNLIRGSYEGRGGLPLKVGVMSATVNIEALVAFFGNTMQPANGTSLSDSHQEEQEEWSGFSDESAGNEMTVGLSTIPAKSVEVTALPDDRIHPDSSKIATCHIEGRQYTVQVIYSPEPVQDFVDASLHTIFQIHYKEPLPGDILVFLTGQTTVESLEHLVAEYAIGMRADVPKLLILPLFAALPQAVQQKVFLPAPPRTRKVILATNIAETSVTVSGVRYVIDCGKSKIKQFRTSMGLDSLLVKPISKSAAIQRKGRAGREAPGKCYRLYTEPDYLQLQQQNTPEILRCDLAQAVLTMKARGIGDITRFPFLDPPRREALEKALLQLYQLKALDEFGAISHIGLEMAKLPLTAPLARVLLAAAEPDLDCVSEAIDIISALSVENILLALDSEEKKEQAETARQELYRREGDHLTLLTTVRAYHAESTDRRQWAEKHFVSHRAMQAVMDVRKQLRSQCERSKMLVLANESETLSVPPEVAASILKCFLKGFATNIGRLMPDGSYKTMIGNQTVAIHPSSVLFGKKVEAIMYNEFVFTNRSYARGVSAVQWNWIGEVLGV